MLLNTSFALVCLLVSWMAMSALLTPQKGPTYSLLVAYFLWMLLVPGWVQSANDRFFWNDDGIPRSYQLEGLAIVFIFLLAFELMSIYQIRKWDYSHIFETHGFLSFDFFTLQHLALSSFLAMGFSLVCVAVLGLEVFVGTRATESEFSDANSMIGLFSTAPRAVVGAHLAMLVSSLRTLSLKQNSNITAIMCTTLATLVSMICLWPTALPRFVLLGILITLASILIREKNWLLKVCLTTLFPIGLFTLVPLIGTYNRTENLELDQILTMPIFNELLYSGDYDSFEWIANTAEFVDENGVCYGMNLLSAILFWVPRSIFTQKLESSGSIVAEYFGMVFTNVSCPLPAEAFFAFGWIGVVFIALLSAYCVSWLDRQFIHKKSIVHVAVTACVLGQLCILLRGSMLGVSNFVVVEISWIYLIVFCCYVLRTFNRR